MAFILNFYFYFILTLKKYNTQKMPLVIIFYYIYPFFHYFLSFMIFMRYFEYVADFNIFMLSLSFSYYLLPLFKMHLKCNLNKIRDINTLPSFFFQNYNMFYKNIDIKNIDILILNFARMIILYNISIHD